jgi:hypothetical protein
MVGMCLLDGFKSYGEEVGSFVVMKVVCLLNNLALAGT